MFISTLSPKTLSLFSQLQDIKAIRHFYLSGGTALALQLGHRESEDLDFFSKQTFDSRIIQRELENISLLKKIQMDKDTLNCSLLGVKLQFLHYPYKLIRKKIDWRGVYLSDKLDIALTKIITISSRGSKKDFIDLFFLLKEYDLKQLFTDLKKKYQKSDYNQVHLLKSLVYFEDADKEPLPKMHRQINWNRLKQELVKKVKATDIIHTP